MELVYHLTALPGQCFLCRSPNRPWFIDTQMSVDVDDPFLPNGHLGAVYICSECLREMSALGAFIAPDEYKHMKEKLESKHIENFELTKKVRGLEQAVNGLLEAGYQRIETLRTVSSFDVSEQVDERPGEESPEEGEPVAPGEGETPEQTDDEGVDELRPDGDESSESSKEFSLNF